MTVVRMALAGALLTLSAWAVAQAAPSAVQTGPVDGDFAEVDRLAQDYLARYGQPGASLVIAWGDRIVYAQGYGWADREARVPTSPWMEYRLASVSKSFTAAAVMRLVEQGRVALDAKAWGYVSPAMAGEPADARIKQVTVRQLLTHSWGIDRAVASDPMGSWVRENGQVLTTCPQMLRYQLLRMTLNFNPGARYAYNNTGYCWLDLIAQTVDGRPLESQLSEMLGPEPMSTGRVRIGSVLPAQVTPDEPHHYDYAGAPQQPPVPGLYPAPEPALVPRPYGYYTLAGYGGSGGLMASPLTVMRFVQRLQGIRQPALLQPQTWNLMQTEQVLPDGTRNAGLGVQTILAWTGYPDRWYSFQGNILGTRTGWLSTPRSPGGPMVTIVGAVNGTRSWPSDGMADDNIFTELLYPVLYALDTLGTSRLAAKTEIATDRLIAWGSTTEAWLADRLFDWGERTYPQLLQGPPVAGEYDGYRYRYYAPTQTYVGVKNGQVVLYQPAVNPSIVSLGTLADFLPSATPRP